MKIFRPTYYDGLWWVTLCAGGPEPLKRGLQTRLWSTGKNRQAAIDACRDMTRQMRKIAGANHAE